MYRLFFLLVVLTSPAWVMQDAEEDQYTDLYGDFAASHILVAFQGSVRSAPGVTRNIPEAKARAEELLAKVKADPSIFEELARSESDGATGPTNGYLGPATWGKFDSKFEKEVKRLKVGEISASPVETDFGFHIIRREPLRVKSYAMNLFVITYRGADVIEGIAYRSENRKQTKEEAAAKIKELQSQVTAETFADMQPKGDFRKPGGFYGNFQRYDSAMTQDLAKIFDKIPFGGVSEILDLPFGFAIAQRVKTEKLAAGRILILHNRIKNVPAYMTRTKDEALLLAKDALAQVLAEPDQFGKVAKKVSEGMYKGRGGTMPVWLRGGKDIAFEEPLLTLKVGEIYAEVLDLEDGLTIIQRLDPANP